MTPMPESALDRLTIIEYNRTGGAAYATKLMADLGAEVIKVEPLTGDPDRDWKAYDLTTLSAGGWTWLNGWPGHPEMPPLRPFGRQSAYQAGVNAALATMGALLARLRTGRGQHVEVSAQECITAILEMTFAFWPYMNAPTARWGQRPIHPIDFFQCKDGGWIFVLCVEEHQWQRLVE